jgi:hypothetical protein
MDWRLVGRASGVITHLLDEISDLLGRRWLVTGAFDADGASAVISSARINFFDCQSLKFLDYGWTQGQRPIRRVDEAQDLIELNKAVPGL